MARTAYAALLCGVVLGGMTKHLVVDNRYRPRGPPAGALGMARGAAGDDPASPPPSPGVPVAVIRAQPRGAILAEQ